MYDTLEQRLNHLEHSLHVENLWSATPPSLEDLASQQPFAVDRLSIEQWLQFIFIPRMRHLVKNKRPLPQTLCILPIVEQSFTARLITAPKVRQDILAIDMLFETQ